MNSALNQWRTWLSLIAALLILLTLVYTNYLSRKLMQDEKTKVEQIAKTFEELFAASADEDLTYYLDITSSNKGIPLITVAEDNEIINFNNLNERKAENPEYVVKRFKKMKNGYPPLTIDLPDGSQQFMYYSNSNLLNQLRWFPAVQLFIIGLFLTAAYYLFSKARQAEQNKVWVGMSKETAHQLGTPISSLMAWVEYLKESEDEKIRNFVPEIEKDMKRLELITDRFSKIGSKPTLQKLPIYSVINDSVDYMKKRSSKDVVFTVDTPDNLPDVMMYPPLFNWVLENLFKNALDAMSGQGQLSVRVKEANKQLRIDVSDSGKGIAHRNKNIVFRPGYSTKKRGWGLGLSLSKRIIEEYHKGKIYVSSSEINKGTTFTIKMPVKN